jgi:hypothetical protein
MVYYGDFPTGATVRMPFQTFDSNGASITITGFAAADIEIYKNGGTTQRSSDAGYTATTDFDALTGLHMVVIDTSDNTDAGFFAAGNEYFVAVSAITADTQTVSFWAGSFSIERSGGILALLKDATFGLSAIETLVDGVESTLGSAGAGLTAIPWNATWDAEVQSEVNDGLVAYGASTVTNAGVADAVWDEVLSGHLTAGSTGAALNGAGSAGDPWTTSLPGAYGVGSAGYIVGTNLNATVSSRATQTSVDTVDDLIDTEVAAIKTVVDAILVDTGTTLDAAIAVIDANVDSILVDTVDIQSRLPAALVSGRMDSSVGVMAANVLTATAIASDAITAAKVAADVTTEIQTGLPSASTIADAVWSEVITPHAAVTDSTASRLEELYGWASTIETKIDTIDTVVDNILVDTGSTGVIVATNNDKTGYAIGVGGIGATAFAAGAIDAASLAQSAGQEIADEVLNRDIAGGASGGSRNVRNALRALRNRQAIATGTLTVYQEDDTTSAWTAAVTTAAGDPITQIDPA